MKTFFKTIQALWRGLNKVNQFIGVLLLMGIIYCIGGQIFSRAFADKVWPWAEELAEVFLIGTIVLYNGFAEQTDEHVRLEALFSVFPKLKQPMLQIGRFATMILCVLIIYTEARFIPQIVKGTTKVVRIPLPLIHGMILVGFALYFIDLSINCYKYWKHIPIDTVLDTNEESGKIFDAEEEGGSQG